MKQKLVSLMLIFLSFSGIAFSQDYHVDNLSVDNLEVNSAGGPSFTGSKWVKVRIIDFFLAGGTYDKEYKIVIEDENGKLQLYKTYQVLLPKPEWFKQRKNKVVDAIFSEFKIVLKFVLEDTSEVTFSRQNETPPSFFSKYETGKKNKDIEKTVKCPHCGKNFKLNLDE